MASGAVGVGPELPPVSFGSRPVATSWQHGTVGAVVGVAACVAVGVAVAVGVGLQLLSSRQEVAVSVWPARNVAVWVGGLVGLAVAVGVGEPGVALGVGVGVTVAA